MNKLKVIMTRGLSCSGKSFWAKQFAKDNPNTIIVTKDDIREAMGATPSNGKRVKESRVVEKRNELILEALNKGKNIVVADTNLRDLHIKNVKALVFPKYRDRYDFEVKDFTDVSLETCLERAKLRPEGVEFWKKIIMSQKNQYLIPKKLYENPEYWNSCNLPKAVVVDMDGTLAIHQGRSPFDFAKCTEDMPNAPLLDIVKMYGKREDVAVIIFSGRPDTYKEQTVNWLHSYGVKFDHIFMRKEGDMRNDKIVKNEIFDAEIAGKYLVYAMFEDRKRVVENWVEKGMPVFAFGNPYHEF